MGSLREEFHYAAVQDNLHCQRRNLSATLRHCFQIPHWSTEYTQESRHTLTPFETRMTWTHEKSPSLPKVYMYPSE